MKPYHEEGGITIYHGDCREIDAWDIAGGFMVTDPPYGIRHASNKRDAPRRGCPIEGDADLASRDEVLARWMPRPAIVFGTCRTAAPQIPIRAVLVWDKGAHVGMGDLSLPWKQNWEHIYVSGVGFVGRRDGGVLRAARRLSQEVFDFAGVGVPVEPKEARP